VVLLNRRREILGRTLRSCEAKICGGKRRVLASTRSPRAESSLCGARLSADSGGTEAYLEYRGRRCGRGYATEGYVCQFFRDLTELRRLSRSSNEGTGWRRWKALRGDCARNRQAADAMGGVRSGAGWCVRGRKQLVNIVQAGKSRAD